jgi:hypothetical protein
MSRALHGVVDMKFPRYGCNSLSAYVSTVGLMQVYAAFNPSNHYEFFLTDLYLNRADFHAIQMVRTPGTSDLRLMVKILPKTVWVRENIDYYALDYYWRVELE